MKIYISSAASAQEEMAKVAETYRADGHEVVSTWHDRKIPTGYDGDYARLVHAAITDFDEVRRCHRLIAFHDERSGGGMASELGFALALGKEVTVFTWDGEAKTLVHFHPDVVVRRRPPGIDSEARGIQFLESEDGQEALRKMIREREEPKQ